MPASPNKHVDDEAAKKPASAMKGTPVKDGGAMSNKRASSSLPSSPASGTRTQANMQRNTHKRSGVSRTQEPQHDDEMFRISPFKAPRLSESQASVKRLSVLSSASDDAVGSKNLRRKNIISRLLGWFTSYNGPPSIRFENPPPHSFLDFASLMDSRDDACVLFATDELFGSASNLCEPNDPVVLSPAEAYNVSDGWITRRRREFGHDWCVIELSFPAKVYGLEVNLTNMGTDRPPAISIEGAFCPGIRDVIEKFPMKKNKSEAIDANTIKLLDDAIDDVLSDCDTDWMELLHPQQADFTSPSCTATTNYFIIQDPSLMTPLTHLRVNLFPDGGIARIRAFGEASKSAAKFLYHPAVKQPLNLVSPLLGGNILSFNDKSLVWGHPKDIISKHSSEDSSTSPSVWESNRRGDRPPIIAKLNVYKTSSTDWAVLKLGAPGEIQRVLAKFNKCEGRAPHSIKVEVIYSRWLLAQTLVKQQSLLSEDGNFMDDLKNSRWNTILEATADTFFMRPNGVDVDSVMPATHVRLTLIPDGAISHFEVIGIPE